LSEKTVNPHVLMCVCGGIAAYKAVEVLRLLQKAGCEVRVASTQDGLRFVGSATWEGLVHHPTPTSLYGWADSSIPHIYLSEWADAVLVVPATANTLAKMATGIADDLVSSTLLAIPRETPLFVAPAMNMHMWQSAATQHNVETLKARGVRVVMPVEGHLACDAIGEGKLATVEDIAGAVLEALESREDDGSSRALVGHTVLVTAGPTHEAIDPVRYIANRSSGKMGYAIATQAARRGAKVVLVSGPTTLAVPEGVQRVDVISAAEMYEAVVAAFDEADIAICAAAVADYTPAKPADHKLKKAHEHLDTLELVETKDILAAIGARKNAGDKSRFVVGFAAETDDLIANAFRKLEHKGCDLVVANDVSRADSGFGSDTNHVSLLSATGVEELPTMTKTEVADRLLDAIERLFVS
jgi:phosphopantothenoylcysteine decarboxylase/phosphopantothenate--cysteine ligase